MSEQIKRVLLRFLRGTVAGAVATMIPLLPQAIGDVKDIQNWLMSLGLAAFIGSITGLILAIDKALRDNPE